jgi:hypothetical protein
MRCFPSDVIVAKGAAVLELFASKDQALLVWRDTCFQFTPKSSFTEKLVVIALQCHQRIAG